MIHKWQNSAAVITIEKEKKGTEGNRSYKVHGPEQEREALTGLDKESVLSVLITTTKSQGSEFQRSENLLSKTSPDVHSLHRSFGLFKPTGHLLQEGLPKWKHMCRVIHSDLPASARTKRPWMEPCSHLGSPEAEPWTSVPPELQWGALMLPWSPGTEPTFQPLTCFDLTLVFGCLRSCFTAATTLPSLVAVDKRTDLAWCSGPFLGCEYFAHIEKCTGEYHAQARFSTCSMLVHSYHSNCTQEERKATVQQTWVYSKPGS